MKLSLFLFLTLISTQAAVYSQNEKITMSLKDVTVEQVLSKIELLSQYNFLYNDTDVQFDRIITVDAKRESVEKILKRIFRNTTIEYSVLDNQIVLKGTPEKGATITKLVADKTEEIADFVKGTVTDNQKRPLPGVTVKTKKSNQVAVTDANGNFTIQADKGDVLVFSSIGFVTKEIQITTDAIQVQLEEKTSPLDEVVVGSNLVATTRRAETASTIVFTAKDLERIPSNNLNDIFTGYVPSAFLPALGQSGSAINPSGINSPFGVNGVGNTLTIRGGNGIGTNTPLKVYLDGIEMSEDANYLGTIDKSSIEKIEVVRGASAATLYGSGASSGIILITTKKAFRNRTAINLSSAAGFINSKWVSQKAFQQEQTINISQSLTDNINYLIGGNLQSVGEYLPYAHQKDVGIYANLNLKFSDKLSIGLNTRYSLNSQHGYNDPVFDNITDPTFISNYPIDRGYNARIYHASTLSGGININYTPVKWWQHSITAGSSQSTSKGGLDNSEQITQNYLLTHSFFTSNYVSTRPTFRYNNSITLGNKENFQLILLTGYEYSSFVYHQNQTSSYYQGGQPFDPSVPSFITNTSYTKGPEITSNGLFAQAAVSYLDKYFLTIAYRKESSNVFKVTSNNPKIGFTTNHELGNFIIKPRIQYGVGVTLPPYDAIHPLPASIDDVGVESLQLANPNIKPQTQRGFDYGLEIYSKNGDFRFEAVYYRYNLLDSFYAVADLEKSTPTLQVYSQQNISAVRNTGWEFTGNYHKKGLRLASTFSITNSFLTEDDPYLFLVYPALKKGDVLPSIPKYTFAESIGYDFKRVFGNTDKFGFTIAAVGSAKGKISDFYNTLVNYFSGTSNSFSIGLAPMPTIVRVNLTLEYQPLPTLSFFTSVKNILNNNESELGNIYPVQGASWLFGLRYRLTK